MGSVSTLTRVGGLLLAGFFAIVAVAMAAAPPVEAPEVGEQPGPRALERPEARAPARTVGDAISGRERRVRPEAAFPVKAAPDYGAADAGFGAGRSGHMHEGQDVFAPAGTPLVAVRDGVVLETGDDGGRGNYIALFSPARRQTYLYLHMQRPSPLAPGDRVRTGGPVGRVGCTGSCWGDHLHFEVRLGRGSQARPVDPLPFLRRAQQG